MPEYIERKVLVESSVADVTALAAQLVKTVICEAVGDRGACYLALAGGTTPHALYESLAELATDAEVPWSQVCVFFGDERDVPLDHVESNYGMAQRTLLDHVPIQPTRVYPMRADAPDLGAAAREYEATIRDVVPTGEGHIPRFDLILLGMGADGHTASLFPNSDALSEEHKLVCASFVPVLGRSRMTVTYPLINVARNVLMLVTGSDKAEAVAMLLGGEPGGERLPAANVAPTDGTCMLILDAAAARKAGLRPV